ncbi:MAG: N-acetylmuramoyl-L-alanine amidase [Anaerolineae bacterium]|nr:N-acetylmuramoyl-L-alanine amidase [Gloeobacterales cyanobacterium ES-bin-313]
MKRASFFLACWLATASPLNAQEASSCATALKAPDRGCFSGSDVPTLASRNILCRPIYTPEREALSLEYFRLHYNPEATSIDIDPRIVVAHWTDGPTAAGALATFRPTRLGGDRPELKKGGALNVSSQFVVDRNGDIYQLMPTTCLARHVIGLNWAAIGIENAGGDPKYPLTKKQLEANIWLVQYLKAKHPRIAYLSGHFEYGGFRGTPLWHELLKNYYTSKSDPGKKFMANLRSGIKANGLELKEPPQGKRFHR